MLKKFWSRRVANSHTPSQSALRAQRHTLAAQSMYLPSSYTTTVKSLCSLWMSMVVMTGIWSLPHSKESQRLSRGSEICIAKKTKARISAPIFWLLRRADDEAHKHFARICGAGRGCDDMKQWAQDFFALKKSNGVNLKVSHTETKKSLFTFVNFYFIIYYYFF